MKCRLLCRTRRGLTLVLFSMLAASHALAAEDTDPCASYDENLSKLVGTLTSLRRDADQELATQRARADELHAKRLRWSAIADAIGAAGEAPAKAIAATGTPKQMVAGNSGAANAGKDKAGDGKVVEEATPPSRATVRSALGLAATDAQRAEAELLALSTRYDGVVSALRAWEQTLSNTTRPRAVTNGGSGQCVLGKNDLKKTKETLDAVSTRLLDLLKARRQLEVQLQNVKSPDEKAIADAIAALIASDAAMKATLSALGSTQTSPSATADKSTEGAETKGAETRREETDGTAAKNVQTAIQGMKVGTIESAEKAVANSTTKLELSRGDGISYGLTTSLLRFHVLRDPAAAGRERSYEPTLDVVPAEIGFQVTVAPHYRPMRLRTSEGKPFQLISLGGMLLVEPHRTDLEKRSSLTLAAIASFLDDTIGIGIGFDLYRGIPVRGADGQPRSATAQTGLLSWALSPTGAVTPENLLFLVTLNASSVAAALVKKGESK